VATREENLDAWLRDAHAMENQAVELMERQTERLKNYPELLAKAREHLEVSRRQAERLQTCIDRRGAGTSALKTVMGKLTGTVQQLTGLFTSDEVMKSCIANFAFEHYEIASYTILAETARQAGDQETARICEENMREEQEMARWLEQHLPTITRQYLERDAAGQTATR
jgi:ferritin-like metal-binding protein YciE